MGGASIKKDGGNASGVAAGVVNVGGGSTIGVPGGNNGGNPGAGQGGAGKKNYMSPYS